MPSITLTATQDQVDRLLAALPPDYPATGAGAKQFLYDCAKERVRAKEQGPVVAPTAPPELVMT